MPENLDALPDDATSVPVFDMGRPESGFGGVGSRHVLDCTDIVMRVDETDEFIKVPVRAVLVDDHVTGWSLEIGPYSVSGSDACALANALARYGRMSGDFQQANDVGSKR